MAGDGQPNDKPVKKAGAKTADTPTPPTTLSLLELQGQKPPTLTPKTEQGIVQAQNVMDRNKSGPVGDGNIYHTNGGVAPGYNVGGKQPQLDIPNGLPTAQDRAAQAAAGQKRLDDLANQNQTNIKAQLAPPRTDGIGFDGKQLHGVGPWGVSEAAFISTAYGSWLHPSVQKALIPGQMAADQAIAEGKVSTLRQWSQIPRKAYLDTFSPVYQARTELAKILPAETDVRKQLAGLRSTAQENIEALTLNKSEVSALKKTAAEQITSSTLPEKAEEIARAGRQVKYLEPYTTVGARSAARAGLEKQVQFLNTNDKYLFGAANDAPLSWKNFSTQMEGSELFKNQKGVLEAAANLAKKEEAVTKIGGNLMTRTEIEALVKTAQKGTVESVWEAGLWKTGKSFGAKFLGSAAFVGAESYGQSQLAMSLAGSDHTTLARWVEPNVPGAVAKTSALILGPSWKTKGAVFAGAQLYEMESNMTESERLLAGAGGMGVAGVLKLAGNKYAGTIALADVAIWGAAELTDHLIFHNDTTSKDTKTSLTNITKDPNDVSHSTMADLVKQNTESGKANPFLMTQIYDNVVAQNAVTSNDTAFAQQVKWKAQLVVQQAQGETILSNGLTQSQYMKMQNPAADVGDPPQHKELWKLVPNERIDIGGQGAKALIGALSSSNMLEAVLAAQKKNDDVAQVDQTRQDIKKQLDSLFKQPHTSEIENALKKATWTSGLNTYNLPELWDASGLITKVDGNFDYAHLTDTIKYKADLNASVLPKYQASLAQSQQDLATAQGNGSPPERVLMYQKYVQARQDALEYQTQFVAKMYRDEALMRMGQVQSSLNKFNTDHVVPQTDLNQLLLSASVALGNAQKYAADNPDLAQLGSITGTMSSIVRQIQTPSYQPNH